MKHSIFAKKHTSSAVAGMEWLCSLWREIHHSQRIWDLPVQDLFILALGGGEDLSSIYKQPQMIGCQQTYFNIYPLKINPINHSKNTELEIWKVLVSFSIVFLFLPYEQQ